MGNNGGIVSYRSNEPVNQQTNKLVNNKGGETLKIDFNSDVPIYTQLGDRIKEDILAGIYSDEEQIPSTTEVSTMYKINPATVAKGYNNLVNEGIIYKKRGVGMFVSVGAAERLKLQRKNEFCEKYILEMLKEASRLGITKQELLEMIQKQQSIET